MAVARILLALLVLVITTPSVASQPAESEIEYLLQYVENSGCLFIRNGSEHDSPSAASHLRLKLKRGKRYVNSPEQFIDRLASESSWTGNKYQIICQGKTEPVGDWLHRALAEYRRSEPLSRQALPARFPDLRASVDLSAKHAHAPAA